MEKYRNLSIEELKEKRKNLCFIRNSIDAKRDNEAWYTDLTEEEKAELDENYDKALDEILKIDKVYDEKIKNINRR